jgi:hypothetical protein
LHSTGFDAFSTVLPEAASCVLRKLKVPFGVALLEDSWHRLCRAEVVPGEGVFERDAALLSEAWDLLARLPFEEVDLLVLREIGKNISGNGMDPNVTGRFAGKPLHTRTGVNRLTVLDLTEGSEGNAIGVGQADIVTERLWAKIDWAATYANASASKNLGCAKLPVVVATDQEALAMAVNKLTGRFINNPRAVAMANTLEVNHIALAGPLVADAEAAGYSVVGAGDRAQLGVAGNLVRIGGLQFFP